MFAKLNRRIVQTISLLLLHSSWGPEAKWFCNPVLSCHSCMLSWFACPIGVFVHYSGYHLFPWIAVGTLLLIGVLVGRLFCGWVCPFGFLQDLLYKIRSPKITLPRWTSHIKYAVLILTVFAIPFFLGEQTMYSFCRICPASAIQVTIPGLLSQPDYGLSLGTLVKLAVLVLVLILAVLNSRSFCKVLCPIGALLAPLNHITFWKVKVPFPQCVSCNGCDKACPTDVKPSERFDRGLPANRSLDCVICHDCRSACRVGRKAAAAASE